MKFVEYLGYIVYESGLITPLKGGGKPFDNGRGYLVVRVFINGKRSTKAVHRLIAECWVPNPKALSEVNHKDGDKLNNAAHNLEWVSRSENIAHAYANGLRSARGGLNANCKTTEADVVRICEMLAAGEKSSKIRDAGYDYGLVRQIRCRRSWKHISENFTW